MKKIKVFAKFAIVLVILIALLSTIWDFSIQLSRTLESETYRTLSQISRHSNQFFISQIKEKEKALTDIASTLSRQMNWEQANISQSLQRTKEYMLFDSITILDANGNGYTNENLPVNATAEDYFQRAMQGETVICKPVPSTTDKDVSSIVLAVPLKNNETTIGVLCGAYSASIAVSTQVENTTAQSYSFIVSKAGDFVYADEHTDRLSTGSNLLRFFKNTQFPNYSLDSLKTAMEQNESGSFSYISDGKKRFSNFSPTGINDWYIFSMSSDAFFKNQQDATNRLVLQLLWKTVFVLLLFAAFVVYTNRKHTKELSTANREYQSLLSNINGGVIITTFSKNQQGVQITYCNDGFAKLTGYTLTQMEEQLDSLFLSLVPPEDREEVFQEYVKQVTSQQNTYSLTYRIVKKDGTILWVLDNGHVVKNELGVKLNHSILTDITLSKQQEETIRLNEERFRIAVSASNSTVFELDLENQMYTYFENPEQIFGVSSERLMKDTMAFRTLNHTDYSKATAAYFIHPDDSAIIENALIAAFSGQSGRYEARIRQIDGNFIWCLIDLHIITSKHGRALRLVAHLTNVDAEKSKTKTLEKRAQTDPLTGLYNKTVTVSCTDDAIKKMPNALHALLVLDVDNFKGVNDILGHAYGDAVLVDVCAKLKSLFYKNDIVGRIGGDEFAVLMQNAPSIDRVLKKAAEITALFRDTYAGEKLNYKISCSIGIATSNKEDCTYAALFAKADTALYSAKGSGKDRFVLYDPSSVKLTETSLHNRHEDEEVQVVRTQHNFRDQIFELRYDAKDFRSSIHMALALIGHQYHASRAYVFENDAESQLCSNVYEWCGAETSPRIKAFQNVSLQLRDHSYLNNFGKDGLFYCSNTNTLASEEAEFFASNHIRSTLQTLIINDGKVNGFVGIDDCTENRTWTMDEIEALTFLSKILGIFVLEEKAKRDIIENMKSRMNILDALPDYICVVNPNNHQLEYVNQKMTKLLPNVKSGAFCYQTLQGSRSSPCETCLVERIRQGNLDNLEIISSDKQISLHVTASYINWSNHKKMVLLHGVLDQNKPTHPLDFTL